MLDRVTLDASVVVSAFSPNEEAAKDSRHLLELLLRDRVVIVVPTLIRPEIVAAMRRATGDPGKAKVFEESFSRLPGVVFQELDDRIADAAVEIVAGAGLRGADAVYAATARRFEAALVTLDGEQRTRLPTGIPALYPEEAIALL